MPQRSWQAIGGAARGFFRRSLVAAKVAVCAAKVGYALIVIGDLARSGAIEPEEWRLIQQFVRHAPIEALAIPFCIGFSGAMK